MIWRVRKLPDVREPACLSLTAENVSRRRRAARQLQHDVVVTAVAPRRARVGISGWKYTPWRGVFYPQGLRQASELSFASRAFPTIELNGSFYSLQRPTSYRAWHDATPDDFVFAVKGGRYVTHMKRLRDVKPALANFFASGLLCLGTSWT